MLLLLTTNHLTALALTHRPKYFLFVVCVYMIASNICDMFWHLILLIMWHTDSLDVWTLVLRTGCMGSRKHLTLKKCFLPYEWDLENTCYLVSAEQAGLFSLHWRHNGHDSVWNHQPHDCLLNCLFKRKSKKTSKLRVTGLCVGNSPVTGEFPA